MKHVAWFLALVIGAYVAAVGIGCAPSGSACSTNGDFVVFLAKKQEAKDGRYAVRRVWPRLDEFVPFQSVFVASRDGEDCTRVTLRRFFAVKSGACSCTPIPKEKPNQAPTTTAVTPHADARVAPAAVAAHL